MHTHTIIMEIQLVFHLFQNENMPKITVYPACQTIKANRKLDESTHPTFTFTQQTLRIVLQHPPTHTHTQSHKCILSTDLCWCCLQHGLKFVAAVGYFSAFSASTLYRKCITFLSAAGYLSHYVNKKMVAGGH